MCASKLSSHPFQTSSAGSIDSKVFLYRLTIPTKSLSQQFSTMQHSSAFITFLTLAFSSCILAAPVSIDLGAPGDATLALNLDTRQTSSNASPWSPFWNLKANRSLQTAEQCQINISYVKDCSDAADGSGDVSPPAALVYAIYGFGLTIFV